MTEQQGAFPRTDYALHAAGDWAGADFRGTGTGEPVGRLDGFADVGETLAVLTAPLSGFCLRRDGSLLELRVKHDVLQPQIAVADAASFSVFEDLNLCPGGSAPHSVLLQRSATFDVLPPRLAKPPARRGRPR